MKTVWKYKLDSRSVLAMPMGSQILTVHEQEGKVCLWALVEPDMEYETRKFVIIGTGQALSEKPYRYIGTTYLEGGAFVFHVFEIFDIS